MYTIGCMCLHDYQKNLIVKMLCLYHFTLITGRTRCSMLSILNKIALQKEHFMTNNRSWTKSVKTQQQQTKKRKKVESFVSGGNRSWDL